MVVPFASLAEQVQWNETRGSVEQNYKKRARWSHGSTTPGRAEREAFPRRAGVSQEAFAFDCGLHRTYISGVERGVRNPTVLALEKIAAALKVPSARLLEELPRKSKR